MKENIREYANTARRDLRVDAESGVLRGVKIIGCSSRNGRQYPNKTLRDAIPLYENTKVNLDHPKGDPAGPRSYQDRFGAIHNVRLEENEGLFADFRFNPKHAVAAQLLWDAENAPENVGFSHNVEALVRPGKDCTVVEKILKVRSVDLVADPATTAGLFESQAVHRSHNEEPKDVIDKVTKTQNGVQSSKSLVELSSERDTHNPSVDSFYEYLSRKLLDSMPGFDILLGKEFLESLTKIDDCSLQIRLFEERIKLFEHFCSSAIDETQPVSREQFVRETPLDTKTFVGLLRR